MCSPTEAKPNKSPATRNKSKTLSYRSFVNRQPMLAHVIEMVPRPSCLRPKTSSRVFNFCNFLVQFFAPFLFVLFKLSSVVSLELRFASLYYRCEFRLIFFEPLGDRLVWSFAPDRFGRWREKP